MMPTWTKACTDCGEEIARYRGEGDIQCHRCGAWYNAGGQQLRSRWMDNPAWRYDDIDDMEGYEMEMLAYEESQSW